MFVASFGLKTPNNDFFEYDGKQSIYFKAGFVPKSRHMPASGFGSTVIFGSFHHNSWSYCRDTDIQSSSAPGDSVFMLLDYLSHFIRQEKERKKVEALYKTPDSSSNLLSV